MKIQNVPLLLFLFTVLPTEAVLRRRERSVSNSLADALGIRGSSNSNKRKKAPLKITPPLRLKPGETAERPPGWTHCIKHMKASLTWRSFKSPGYPDFLESQIQCSWMVEAPIGMRVKVAFRDLDMIGATGSCAKQFVQIIDISTGKSQGRFCGGQRPGDYVTLGTKARIDLQADKAVTKVRGFLISVIAVKEIPGFRSSKTFPSMGKGSDAAPGKVDVKNFLSHANANTPKQAPGAKRASRRLVYESDRNPQITDPSGTTTESAPANTVGSDNDFGWIGDDSSIDSSRRGNRAPSSGPLKVRTGNRRTRPPAPTNNGPIIITPSTLPVRIRAKNLVTPSREPEVETENQGPVIYGKENQPYDPSSYTTLHPVRADVNRFVDHRPEKLTTTNLIIIIACGCLFIMMLSAIVLFWWFYRKRRKRKKKKREMEQRKKEQEQQNQVEMNVINLGGDETKMREMDEAERSRELPGTPPMIRDSPPQYSRHEFSHPRDGAMKQATHGEDSLYPRQGEISVLTPRDVGTHLHQGHREMYRRDDIRRYPGHPADYRHKTVDPRRHHSTVPTSQLRHHSLDPRDLEWGHQYDRRRVDTRGKEHSRYLSRGNSGIRQERGYSRGDSRPGPYPNGITGVDDIDEDYCSGVSDNSRSGQAPMRREYSPWELEQQKKERRKKLINGEL